MVADCIVKALLVALAVSAVWALLERRKPKPQRLVNREASIRIPDHIHTGENP